MKIQCDVCSSAEASVFCCADEAALCGPCDRRVHRANKLAGKHRRFSLHHPSSCPLCDICKERRGFVFCQQDRAILCRDCDAPIHTATSLTMKHSRFLLTGVSLSSAPIPFSPPPPEVAEATTTVSEEESTTFCTAGATTNTTKDDSTATISSSISEYLIEMLPGWHVEELLTDDSGGAGNFYQVDDTVPFMESLEAHDPPVPVTGGGSFHQGMMLGGYKEGSGVKAANRRRRYDDVFAVPQIHNGGGSASNRSKPLLWTGSARH